MKDIFNLSALDLCGKITFSMAIFFATAVLYYFYDHYWYPPDDGAYAYVASRILAGDILNLDIHDVHMGYINFLHGVALKIFGNEMVSLRIPLALIGIFQSIILFSIFKPKGLAVAFMASALITSLSFIQFLNPTANWYGLFLTILVIVSLNKIQDQHRYKIISLGFLLMTLFLFRQLTGIITAMGTVCYLLYQSHQDIKFKDSIFAKILFFIMFFGLLGYLVFKTTISAILLFGIWPLLLLMLGFFKVTIENRKTAKMVMHLLLGALFAAIPIILYHIYHGSLYSWYGDTVISAMKLTQLSFIQANGFFEYIIYSLQSLILQPSLTVFLNSIFWIMLILASSILGLMLLLSIYRKDKQNIQAMPMIGVFYGLVTVHFQIPIYLFYSVGLTLCAILWLMDLSNPYKKYIILSVGVMICFVAIFYHAAQPASRSLKDMLNGQKSLAQEKFLAGNVNLWVRQKEADQYQHIYDLVHENVKVGQSIFAFPSNAEIYYITGYSNPFPFFNSAFGIVDQQQFVDVMNLLKTTPPGMVFYTPKDKYNTEYSLEIANYIKANYNLIEISGNIEIYLKPDQI